MKCFISYTNNQREFILSEIIPILQDLKIEVWFDKYISFGELWTKQVYRAINESDFLIVIIDRESRYQYMELGTAIGQSKPLLPIVFNRETIPKDLLQFQYLKYNPKTLRKNINTFIKSLKGNIIDDLTYKIAENRKVIGIKIDNQNNMADALRLTADLIEILERISGSDNFQLIQTTKGSFKSLFGIDLKPWTELIEKIIFFIPEWKKRKNENILIETNIERKKVETKKMDSEIMINEANALLDLLIKSKELGMKFQIDDDIIISINPKGMIKINEPKDPNYE